MHNIAVASDNVNIVITGELEIYRSTDGASTFSLSNQRGDATQTDYAHDDIHELAYNPLDHSLYVGSDGGVYKSTDDGVTYVAKYTGMSNTQYYHFDVSDTDENYILAGRRIMEGTTATELPLLSSIQSRAMVMMCVFTMALPARFIYRSIKIIPFQCYFDRLD